MLTKLVITLEKNKNEKYGYYMGSMLQGVLMQAIDKDYASKLHESQIHPYSQFVSFDQDHIFWHIQALNDDADHYIINTLMDENFKSFRIEHRNEVIQVISKEESKITEDDLIKKYYFGKNPRTVKLQFLTPVSFKKDNQYQIFPNIRLIFQNLMMRFDANSTQNEIFSQDLLEDFENHIHIVGYHLRSTYYYTNSVKIPSFMGNIILKINGPQPMVNLVWLLAKYGEYSGLGIKTGIGMGGMKIIERSTYDK